MTLNSRLLRLEQRFSPQCQCCGARLACPTCEAKKGEYDFNLLNVNELRTLRTLLVKAQGGTHEPTQTH